MFISRLIISFIFSSAIGVLFISCLSPYIIGMKHNKEYSLLMLVSGAGLGLGLTSMFLFIWLILFGFPGTAGYLVVELLAICLLALINLIQIKKKKRAELPRVSSACTIQRLFLSKFGIALVIITLLSLAIFIITFLKHPHGGWDAWASWNLRARFIFRGQENWQNVFRPEIYVNRPGIMGYPLLLVLSVVRGWIFSAKDTVFVPGGIALLFTFATAAILGGSVSLLKNRISGILAAAFFLSTPFIIRHGASQYADMPLAFFSLLAVIFISLYDNYRKYSFLFLSGLSAGLAAWTKNEGVYFIFAVLLAIVIAHGLSLSRNKIIKEVAFFIIGFLPILICIGYFKIVLVQPYNLYPDNLIFDIKRFLDVSIYIEIFKNMAKEFINTENGFIYPILMPILIILSSAFKQVNKETRLFLGLLIILSFAGYFLFYLLKPVAEVSHFSTSLSRLYIQIWPILLFVFFMFFKSPGIDLERKAESNLTS